MGMSTRIEAFIEDTDPTYQKFKKVLLACNEAGINLPKEAQEYFGYTYPELEALNEKLKVKLRLGVHYMEYKADMIDGFEIKLSNLPKEITTIRFINSY